MCLFRGPQFNEFLFTINEKFREDALHTPTPRLKITIFEGCSLKNRTVPKCHLSPARQKIGQEGWQSQQHWPHVGRSFLSLSEFLDRSSVKESERTPVKRFGTDLAYSASQLLDQQSIWKGPDFESPSPTHYTLLREIIWTGPVNS